MAAWRGDLDGVGRLDAEVTRLIGQVDDPQTQKSIRDRRLEAALANEELERGVLSGRQRDPRGVDLGRSQPTRSVTPCSLAALLGDASRFAMLIPSVSSGFCPASATTSRRARYSPLPSTGL